MKKKTKVLVQFGNGRDRTTCDREYMYMHVRTRVWLASSKGVRTCNVQWDSWITNTPAKMQSWRAILAGKRQLQAV